MLKYKSEDVVGDPTRLLLHQFNRLVKKCGEQYIAIKDFTRLGSPKNYNDLQTFTLKQVEKDIMYFNHQIAEVNVLLWAPTILLSTSQLGIFSKRENRSTIVSQGNAPEACIQEPNSRRL